MKKAMIAMSGGVDSSVAAWLMKRDGYDCMGVTMRLFAGEDSCERKGHTCCSLDDVEDARSVARQLGIPYFVFNFTEDFGTQIMDRFVCAYENGFTPNPCIDCNRYMKFEKLMKRAKELDYDYVVTGHYARIEEQDGKFLLKKAIDEKKDQSYVLYSLTQEQLAHTLFPLGGMHKDAVRTIAEEQGLCNARKHDSQDICFVPDGDYAAFLERYTGQPMQPGNFVDEQVRRAGRGDPRHAQGNSVLYGGPAQGAGHQRRNAAVCFRQEHGGKHRDGGAGKCAVPLILTGGRVELDRRTARRGPAAALHGPHPLPPAGTPGHRYPAAGWPRAGGFCRPPARHCPRPGRCAVQRRKRNRRRNDF